MIRALAHTRLVLFNPRRANFPMGDPGAAQEQIVWEHTHLHKATAISFWFPCETLNPITLYELGAWSMRNKPLFVGVHPDYQRKQDVLIQTKLARPDIAVVESLRNSLGTSVTGSFHSTMIRLIPHRDARGGDDTGRFRAA